MKPRQLILLALVTGLLAAAAIYAVTLRGSANVAAFKPQPLFPQLASQMDAVAGITLDTVQGKIVLARDAKGAWRLADRGGWPANFDTVRKSVLALSKLTAVERRTARPENHGVLLLQAPDGEGTDGKGFRITAQDAQGNLLAALILGKVQTPPSGTRPGTAYVRRDGEDQTYLAQGDVNIPLLVSDWIDRALFDIAEDRIRAVTVTPPSGRAYEIRRPDAKAAFTIDTIPAGKELALAALPENIAKAVSLLPLDDATPEGKVDFTGAFRADHKTFDGLVLTSWTVLRGNSRWTRFEAAFDAAQAEAAKAMMASNPALLSAQAVQKQIAEINARTKGWAFKLPGMKATDLTRDYDSLFKTPDPAEKTTPPHSEMEMQ